jgi:peptidyl-prolyl cis-trans isomerase C
LPAQQVGAVPAATAARPAAVVNGEAISMADLEMVLAQAGKPPFEVPDNVQKQLRRQALAMLIDDVVMHQWLKANTPAVTAAEIDAKIADMDAELKKQGKSVASFCKENGQPMDQLRDMIGNTLQWQKYARSNLSDADVQRYYTENKDFFDGTTVTVSHIVKLVSPTASEEQKAKLRAELTDLRQQILAGKIAFPAAAKQCSQCEETKDKGGVIGEIPRKTMVEEPFARAAFAMQPNQLSDIVQTVYGYHLILVTGRKQGTPSDFAKISEQVREFASEEMRQQILSQQRQAAKIEVNIP